MTSGWTWFFLGATGLAACDSPSGGHDRPAAQASVASASTAAVPAATPPPAAAPPPLPTVTMSDRGLSVDGQELPWDKAEGTIATLGARRSDAENKDVAIVAIRTAPAHDVALTASLLLSAWHPKTLTIRSQTRDQAQGEVVLTYRREAHTPDCSTVAMIEKDSGVSVWSKGGGGAQRFARGMAGPDLTLSSEAIRKRANACESPVWFLAAADSVSWGLLFDLFSRTKGDGDFKPKEAVLVPHAPVAGRAVKDD